MWFFWGVIENAGRTGSFLHWASSKGFLSQHTQGPSAPIRDKTRRSCSKRQFSQADAEPIEADKVKKGKENQNEMTTIKHVQVPQEDVKHISNLVSFLTLENFNWKQDCTKWCIWFTARINSTKKRKGIKPQSVVEFSISEAIFRSRLPYIWIVDIIKQVFCYFINYSRKYSLQYLVVYATGSTMFISVAEEW